MVKKRLIGVFLGIVFSLVLVCAAHIITTSDGGTEYSFNEDVSSLYNISVSNTDTGAAANISSVVITLPSSFSFVSDSNGTNATESTFSESSGVLTWTNESGLIMDSEIRLFWFNATAATPGNYNITIATTNSSGTEISNISVEVNDTSVPSAVEFVTPSSDWANISATYIIFNASVTDASSIDTITVYLFNSTLDEINSSTGVGSSSLSGNFSNLSEGIYYINATANDSLGYENSSVTWTVVLDTTAPTVSLTAPADDVSSVTSAYNFTFTPTDSRGIASCRLRFDGSTVGTETDIVNGSLNGIYESSISSGTKDWIIRCTDHAGNEGDSETRQLTVISQGASTGGGGTTTQNAWSNTFAITDTQFGNGYNKLVGEKERIRVRVNSENHYVGVIDVTSTTAKINVSSDPQQNILNIGDEWKVDVTDDDRYDLMVTLEGIVSGDANITVISIDEVVPEGATIGTSTTGTGTTGTSGLESAGAEDEEGSYTWLITILIVVALVAGGVAGYLYWKKQRKMMGFE